MSSYAPVAVYFESSDCLEYVRADDLFYYDRIDSFLTLVRDIDTKKAVGFKLKGFRHYFQHLNAEEALTEDQFVSVMQAFSVIYTENGESILDNENARKAYDEAVQIATNDNVRFSVDSVMDRQAA